MQPTILWWGRYDPDYSRNRILIDLLRRNNYRVKNFRPHSSLFGTLESWLNNPGAADALWVPCFRHTDFKSARRYADKLGVKLIFDPLISSWDKAVFERFKFHPDNRNSLRLLKWEQSLFSDADVVVADTSLHAEFFIETLSAPPDRTYVIPVGADEAVFSQRQSPELTPTPEILFFGSFINLQGPQHIVEAARQVPEARWTLLGEGPLRQRCESLAAGVDNLHFENWLPYNRLPARIGAADIVLGIFGDSPKAGRVIPNKVYQALACGRPVITRYSPAYPSELRGRSDLGLVFVDPADPEAIAVSVKEMISNNDLSYLANQAALTYTRFFSEPLTEQALLKVMDALSLTLNPS